MVGQWAVSGETETNIYASSSQRAAELPPSVPHEDSGASPPLHAAHSNGTQGQLVSTSGGALSKKAIIGLSFLVTAVLFLSVGLMRQKGTLELHQHYHHHQQQQLLRHEQLLLQHQQWTPLLSVIPASGGEKKEVR